jgi:hypothetical protein
MSFLDRNICVNKGYRFPLQPKYIMQGIYTNMIQNNITEINAIKFNELKLLFQNLSNKNIPYAVIKGETLSIMAYGKLGQRNSMDIDILVPLKYISILKSDLLSLGFDINNKNRQHQVTAISSTHQAIPFSKKVNGINVEVDINHDIFWGEYSGNRIDIETFLSDFIEMKIYDCKIKTLPPLKAMIQLILHHYNEFNSLYHLAMRNCISFNMFKDIYYLWKNNKNVISNSLHEISKTYEIIPYVYYIMYYTNKIFNDNYMGDIVKQLKTPEGVYLLDRYGLTKEERKVWNIEFFTRLNKYDVFESIKNDLSEKDKEKLKRAQNIFG